MIGCDKKEKYTIDGMVYLIADFYTVVLILNCGRRILIWLWLT